MKRNNQIDVLKYIACFFVIMIHWDIPLTLQRIMQPLLTTAVPIFFMITGFFYSETVNARRQKKQIKKIAVLTVVANSTHIGWCLFKCLLSTKGIDDFVTSVITPSNLLNLLIFNQPVWRTSIWYINALLAVLVLIWIIEKRGGDLKSLYFLIPILLAFNVFVGTYSFVFPINEHIQLCYSRNFLFCGLPYFLLGHCVYSNKEKVCRLFGQWYNVVFFDVLGCIELYILDSFSLLRFNDHTVWTCFLALSVFCFFIKGEFCVGNLSNISVLGRKYCFVIYVCHSIVIETFYKVINYVSDYAFVVDFLAWIGPILVLFISTLLAHILSCFKAKIKTLKV